MPGANPKCVTGQETSYIFPQLDLAWYENGFAIPSHKVQLNRSLEPFLTLQS